MLLCPCLLPEKSETCDTSQVGRHSALDLHARDNAVLRVIPGKTEVVGTSTLEVRRRRLSERWLFVTLGGLPAVVLRIVGL